MEKYKDTPLYSENDLLKAMRMARNPSIESGHSDEEIMKAIDSPKGIKVYYLDVDSEETSGIHVVFCKEFNQFHGANIPYQQVLKSAAGYYIGDLYRDYEFPETSSNPWLPNSRDSAHYYATREEATKALISQDFEQHLYF